MYETVNSLWKRPDYPVFRRRYTRPLLEGADEGWTVPPFVLGLALLGVGSLCAVAAMIKISVMIGGVLFLLAGLIAAAIIRTGMRPASTSKNQDRETYTPTGDWLSSEEQN